MNEQAPHRGRQESEQSRELLGENIGLQTRLLIGDLSNNDLSIPEELVKNVQQRGIRGVAKETMKQYEEASLNERRGGSVTKQDWEKKMNSYLQKIRTEPDDSTKKRFLKTIGMGEEVDAATFYEKYLSRKSSNITQFVADIEEHATRDDIENNAMVIRMLGNSFGTDSSMVIENLIHGVKNIKKNPDLFIEKGVAELNTQEVKQHLLIRSIVAKKGNGTVYTTPNEEETGTTQERPTPTKAEIIQQKADQFAARFREKDIADKAVYKEHRTFYPDFFKDLTQEYITPMALVRRPTIGERDTQHAMLLLKEPYQEEDGKWKMLVYDPSYGKQEHILTNYKPGDKITVDGDVWVIDANKNYKEKIADDPTFNLIKNIADVTLSPLQDSKNDTDCVAYVAYMAFLLNSARDDLSDGEEVILRDFEEKYRIKIQ